MSPDPVGARAGAATVLAVAALAVSCASTGPTVRDVVVDGGTAEVTLTRPVEVEARPGDTVRIRHAGTAEAPRPGADAPDGHGHLVGATHALVAADRGALPPLFVPRRGGAAPNAAVWGHCRGGVPAADLDGCPVPSIEGPRRWDGRSYWSTGAMLPGESREVPLDADLAAGRYTLTCVLHPELSVTIQVGEDPGPPPSPPATGGPGAPSPPTTAEREVATGYPGDAVRVNRFHPAELTIRPGQAVTWTVSSPDPHEVVLGVDEPPELVDTPPAAAVPSAPAGAWGGASPVRSGFLSTDPSAPGGSRFSLTFATPGTYRYHCRFHPVMSGTVTVTEA